MGQSLFCRLQRGDGGAGGDRRYGNGPFDPEPGLKSRTERTRAAYAGMRDRDEGGGFREGCDLEESAAVRAVFEAPLPLRQGQITDILLLRQQT